jgi:hypothetical protein
MKSGRILALFFLGVALCAVANAQNGCGDTSNWTSPSCQVIGAGQLNTAMVNGVNDPNAWTVISRHGEYGQSETECNIPNALAVSGGNLTITTSNSPYTCGDWNQDGTVRNSPSSFPYKTGALQWNTFNFQYGTVITRVRAPNSNTSVWPAIWFLAANCQVSNKYSGDTRASTSPSDSSSTCPDISTTGYQEIDMIEFMTSSHWPQANFMNPSCCGNMKDYNQAPLNDGAFHIYAMNWTQSSLSFTVDGTATGISYANAIPTGPMFMIVQTQTGGAGGSPNNSYLPAQFVVDYIKVCNSNYSASQCSSAAANDPNVIFYDDFSGTGTVPAAPTGLTAVVK